MALLSDTIELLTRATSRVSTPLGMHMRKQPKKQVRELTRADDQARII
jgi:hypothetical protein